MINKSNKRGLGYDIESAEIIGGKKLGSVKYIEVKTTSRVTAPSAASVMDFVQLTRNEWRAALKHKAKFYVYRVYLTRGKTYIYMLKNICKKHKSNDIEVEAPKYNMRFDLMKPGVVDKKEII